MMLSTLLKFDFGPVMVTIMEDMVYQVEIVNLDLSMKDIYKTNSLVEDLYHRFKLYFSGREISFSDVPTFLGNYSQNERQVLRYIKEHLKYGQTVSYRMLAEATGFTKAWRWIGSVMRKNHIPIIIPCHRVVATSGLGGYNSGIETKRRLLKLEGVL